MMLTDQFFIGTKLYQKKFAEIIKPLANYLGITHAIYVNIDKHGRLFSICTQVEWVERFLQEEYYKLDPFMVHPNNIHNGFSFDAASLEQEFKDKLLYDAIINFDWCNSFAYIEKTISGGYIGFDFGTDKNNYHIYNRLINEIKLIKKFIRNINNKLNMIIAKDLKENKMDFAALKGDLFNTQQGLVFNDREENKNKNQLLKELGLFSSNCEQDFFNNISLSPQQINCLREYMTTNNIKMVARNLNLAVTTASSYIEHVKNKLNCNTKNKLFEKAEILESLGYI